MTELETKALDDLLSRANNAKLVSDKIKCLNAYDESRQRQHVKIDKPYSAYRAVDDPDWPDEFETRALLELGRQTKLVQLQDQLKGILGVPSRDSVARISPEEAEEIQEQLILESIGRNEG